MGAKQIPGRFILMPCASDVCQECAVDHPPDAPHNAESLYYQYHFYAIHGRWPTWTDAIAHCSDEVKEAVLEVLKKHGIDVDASGLKEAGN